jgi:DNA primase
LDVKSVLDTLSIKYTDHGDYYKFRCINPSHNDQDPSMTMLKETGYFQCWSCSTKGGLKRFLEFFPGMDSGKFDSLAWEFQSSLNNYSQKKMTEIGRLGFIRPREHSIVIEGEQFNVYEDQEVLAYLRSRNCSDDFIDSFGLQYCRFIRVNGTVFENRITVPVYENKKLVNLEGRTFRPSVETKKKVIYPWGSKAGCLFNYDNLKLDEPIYMTEGIFDLTNLHKVTQSVTSCFGSNMSRTQLDLIKGMKQLHIFPDNDEAGYKMLRQIYKDTDHEFWVCPIPEGKKDAGDCTVDELKTAIYNRIVSVEYFMRKNDLYAEELTW